MIDNNSGIETSAWAGGVQGDSDAPSKKIVLDRGNKVNVIPKAEVARLKAAGKPTIDKWIKEVDAKQHINGAALLKVQEKMIAKYVKG